MHLNYEILGVSKNLIEVNLFGEKKNIDKKNLYTALGQVLNWQMKTSNFTAQLIGLIAKADVFNRQKLAKSFPDEVFAYLLWYWQDGFIEYGEDENYVEKLRNWLIDNGE